MVPNVVCLLNRPERSRMAVSARGIALALLRRPDKTCELCRSLTFLHRLFLRACHTLSPCLGLVDGMSRLLRSGCVSFAVVGRSDAGHSASLPGITYISQPENDQEIPDFGHDRTDSFHTGMLVPVFCRPSNRKSTSPFARAFTTSLTKLQAPKLPEIVN